MTNTVSGVLTSITGSFSDAFDATIGIAVVALGIVVVYGLAARWFGGKRKAG